MTSSAQWYRLSPTGMLLDLHGYTVLLWLKLIFQATLINNVLFQSHVKQLKIRNQSYFTVLDATELSIWAIYTYSLCVIVLMVGWFQSQWACSSVSYSRFWNSCLSRKEWASGVFKICTCICVDGFVNISIYHWFPQIQCVFRKFLFLLLPFLFSH